MAVSSDILRAWRQPRAVMRGHLDQGPREDRALIFLVGACILIFVAQTPYLARLAQLDPAIPLDARIQTALYVWLFFVPLFAYVLALALYGALRLVRVRVGAYGVRLALFWTLLAITPASLFYGLCQGFLGETGGTTFAGLILSLGFFWILIQSLREAASGDGHV